MLFVLEEKEMKNHRRVLVGSLASAALMSLFLVNNGSVKADEVVQPNQGLRRIKIMLKSRTMINGPILLIIRMIFQFKC